ncbi:hypothetical protein SKAU_G00051570 [Synaphobranchus kaupii]|uniref:Uncharacterized protein n=1 Tax=Synaphobranchus kaupii TaxID=118154 RepID=A0A9Q1G454_SYNKA|nr:hypothetical protein SKAU_G00051570 [Synaphobranchus kaupii]
MPFQGLVCACSSPDSADRVRCILGALPPAAVALLVAAARRGMLLLLLGVHAGGVGELPLDAGTAVLFLGPVPEAQLGRPEVRAALVLVLVHGVRQLAAVAPGGATGPHQGVRHGDQQDHDPRGQDTGAGDARLRLKHQQHEHGHG